MGYVNKKSDRAKMRDKAHANWMGGASYFLNDPIKTLRIAASSCFFGEPMYYHRDAKDKRAKKLNAYACEHALTDHDVLRLREVLDATDPQDWRGKTPAKLMEDAIDKALDHDAEATLQFAVELRNDLFIRTTPQIILVHAANHPKVRSTGLIGRYAPKIVVRGDEPAVVMAYQLSAFGRKKIPNAIKRALKAKMETLTEYDLAKYRMEDHAVTTRDVAHLVHPKGVKDSPIYKLRAGELRLTENTWESFISAHGSNKDTWTTAVEKMGHMALLRNLRNLTEHGVDPSVFLDKLVKTVPTGKQLPFRYYSAYRALKGASPKVLDAVEECLMLSLKNLPHFSGKVMSLCDNSGSARSATTSSMGTMQIATIANLTGIITGMVSDEGYLGLFGDQLEVMPIRHRSSIFDQLKTAENTVTNKITGATENGIWLFWDNAIRNEEHWDHVFVYSDMQAGHGGLYGVNPGDYHEYRWRDRYIDVPKLIAQYRTKVNPNVMVYLVQVAGYQDTIVPEFYNRTFILGGWSDAVLRFAAAMTSSYPTQ